MKALLALALLAVVSCSKNSEGPGQPAKPPAPANDMDYHLVLADSRWPDKPFQIDLPLSNENGVKSFESYLTDGAVTKDPSGDPNMGIVTGVVVASPPTENHKWSFHLDPATLTFSDMTTEVCDASLNHVEENLREWIGSVKDYCPWNMRRVIQSIRRGDTELYRRER